MPCAKIKCFCSVHYVKNEVNKKPQKEKKNSKIVQSVWKTLKVQKG